MMHTVDFNFAEPCRRFNPRLMLLLLAILAIFAGLLVYQQQLIQQKMASIADANADKPQTEIKSNAPPSPTLMHSIALAHETQRALNLAWLPMLKALEQAQQANPEIRLLSIQPNPGKSEIVLTGQTTTFDDLVQYQNSLRTQPNLGEAMLLNQRTDVMESGKSLIGFTLSLVWKP